MTRLMWKAETVLALALIAAPLLEAADPDRSTDRVFDLSSGLELALVQAALESIATLPEPDERHRRAVSLLTPVTIAAPATAIADDEEKRWPGDWLVGGFDTTSRWVTGGLSVGLGGYLLVADRDEVRSLGDITQLIPLTAAVGLSVGAGDWQGLRQLGLAGGTAFAITHGIKETVDKTRPDTSANNSFPSGHTAASVSGAAFIWRRYGAKWGAPASIFAAYTGLSRVEGQKHFMDDVISGAAVGLISNWLWTDPIDERARMALFLTKGGAGLNVSIDTSKTPGSPADREYEEAIPQLPARRSPRSSPRWARPTPTTSMRNSRSPRIVRRWISVSTSPSASVG